MIGFQITAVFVVCSTHLKTVFWSGLFMSQDIPLDDDPAPRRHLLAAALASAIVDVEGMWCAISEG